MEIPVPDTLVEVEEIPSLQQELFDGLVSFA